MSQHNPSMPPSARGGRSSNSVRTVVATVAIALAVLLFIYYIAVPFYEGWMDPAGVD